MKTRWIFMGVCFLAMTAWGLAATTVICVPWQGNPLKYHTGVSGQPTELKAVIKTTDTGTIYYRWEFGDGTPAVSGSLSGSAKHNVAVMHTYTGAAGTPFVAQLLVDEVDNTMANAVKDNYLVKLEVNNLDSLVNRAIDRGLWYLYTSQYAINASCLSLNGKPLAIWWYSGYSASPTASAVHAFQINGHKKEGNPNEDPYVEAVAGGLNWLLNGYYANTGYLCLKPYAIGAQTGGNPDSNGNGIGITVGDYYGDRPIYQGGMVMDAIIASGTPDASSERDFDNDGTPDTYREVIQEMCDMYAWGQYDGAASFYDFVLGVNRTGIIGGWRYGWNNHPDNSACQWAAIGMLPAQKAPWGCTVPEWVKTLNDNWLWYSYNQWAAAGTTWGSFGYTGKGTYDATTPSGLVQLVFSGKQTTDPRWITVERWFADNWKDQYSDWLDWNNVYAYYSFTKAMRLAQPQPVVTFSSNGFDWYRGNATKMGMAEKLASYMNTNGRLWDWYGYVFPTSWAIVILKPVLFETAPIACFDADPNPSFSDQNILFDPSCSGHSEPGKNINNLTKFEWDWNNDGIYDESATTPQIITHAFHVEPQDIPKSFWVVLRVTDDLNNVATTANEIRITNPPHPPVAQLMGPYMVSTCDGDTLTLDGSGSFDPDEGQHQAGCTTCPDDMITAYEWDLDGAPYTYQNGTGAVLNLGNGFYQYFPTPGKYYAALRVTDNTALSYPGAQLPNMTDEAFAEVDVYNGCMCDVIATPMCAMVRLEWEDVGAAYYEIHRSFVSPNYGFAFMKQVVGTTRDLGSFTMEQDHWYRILAVFQDGSKCLSKAAYAYAPKELCHPTARPGGPYEACAGEPVTLDGSGSTSLIGVVLEWNWDLDNDGEFDDASGWQVQHTWTTPGVYIIGLQVKSSDAYVLYDQATTTVTVKQCGTKIDILPYNGTSPNYIRANQAYVLSVAVFGSAVFNVKDIASVTFGPTGLEAAPIRAAAYADVNKDGFIDALYNFNNIACKFKVGDTQGTLTATLKNGSVVKGVDSVKVY